MEDNGIVFNDRAVVLHILFCHFMTALMPGQRLLYNSLPAFQ